MSLYLKASRQIIRDGFRKYYICQKLAMGDCFAWFCQPVLGCLSCLFCDCLCCECNCLIFPAPRSSSLPEDTPIHEHLVSTSFHSFQANGRTVPYAEISTGRSRSSPKCFIYFHGNAEDISLVGYFLQPLVEELGITFYSVEYPTYSSYSSCSGLISNKIKEDALGFYDYLTRTRQRQDVLVMGRSIGTGGASYLAGNRNIPLLVLMSPFDSIKNVATGMVGCMGCILKQHFDNESEIIKFNGRLLVIHGEADEVIAVGHGKKLVRTYQLGNAYKNTAKTVYPRTMTHNNFDLDSDIIDPIKTFLGLPL